MKQKFFLSFMAIAFSVLSASAQNEEKLVVNAGNVEHITIANDMNIVLMPETGNDKLISLDANASEKPGFGISDNSMTISLLKQPTRKEMLTVYLYVNKLKTITVESNSTVKTIGVLDTPRLEVFAGSRTKVHVKTNGDIKAHSLNDSEIKVRYLSENLLARQALTGKK
jgi:hypothetical protein